MLVNCKLQNHEVNVRVDRRSYLLNNDLMHYLMTQWYVVTSDAMIYIN